MNKKIDVKSTIETARISLEKEKNLAPEFVHKIHNLIQAAQMLLDQVSINSQNSSKPPSADPNRKKPSRSKNDTNRKPGGQLGHEGKQLKPVDNPDSIEALLIDRRTLPAGKYTEGKPQARQVIDFSVTVCVTEYRAQVLIDEYGNQYVASFPQGVTRPIQYGISIKANAVYMSQYQLIPYDRIKDHFFHQMGLGVCTGSIFNFNREAYQLLSRFEERLKEKLIASAVINVDETGINIKGKKHWLHTACNEKWTHFYPHQKRGSEAMSAIGILPRFQGVMCHDHWIPYYLYHCLHSLCNAHHIRELKWSATEDNQQWAITLKDFLLDLNDQVDAAGGMLPKQQWSEQEKHYLSILDAGEKECPLAERKLKQRGRVKQTKSRNLLDRLRKRKEDVLRFMTDVNIPFTNNRGENDLRMTKVQQKISGCFRSFEGALIFCRIRSYLLTCQKHGINPTEALNILFRGKLPDFMNSS